MNTNVSTRDDEKVINMLLFCPECHTQHIDKPDTDPCYHGCQFAKDVGAGQPECVERKTGDCLYMHEGSPRWTNPPHRSHLCHQCGSVWRPADVCTNGVATITTRGTRDTWSVA